MKEQGANVSASHTFGIDLINPFTDLQGWDRHRVYGFYEADFSGWWSLMVDLDGPAPAMPEKQFIKRDDIMFGYESRRQDVVTVVPPNLVVAHGEEGAPAYYYYDIRNDLILRARNADRLSLSLKQLVRIAGYLMLSLQADRQKMFNAALADFLAGPAALQASDIGQTLKRVRAMASRTAAHPAAAQGADGQGSCAGGGSRGSEPETGPAPLGGGDRPPPRAAARLDHALGLVDPGSAADRGKQPASARTRAGRLSGCDPLHRHRVSAQTPGCSPLPVPARALADRAPLRRSETVAQSL
ncbi:hypothetical protein [Ponticoccus litoralis]|uniref:Uncharacterized protein n=1 Tax=Ponticoccus litoralis TaxID=422297 RepID=A0AAW9SQU8_9RHOB